MVGGNLPYVIFYTLFLAICMSAIYIINRRKSIYINVDMEESVFVRGQSSSITINVGNESNLPNCYLLLKNDMLSKFDDKYKGNVVSLMGSDDIIIRNNIRLKNRGIYDFGNVFWSIRDIFFIFQYSSNAKNNFCVKVYPRVKEIKRDFIIKNYVFQNVIRNKSGYEDPYTMSDVRKYNYGDSLKKVHWKVSAKYNELYVKNLDNVIGQHCHLFMDMSESEYSLMQDDENEEKAVEFCLSFVKYMLDKGLKTTLHINNLENKEYEINHDGDFPILMDYFLENKSIGKRYFPNYIKTNSQKVHNNNWVGIICIKFYEEMTDELVALNESGCDVNLFYEITESLQRNNIEKLKNLGIKCINISELVDEIYE